MGSGVNGTVVCASGELAEATLLSCGLCGHRFPQPAQGCGSCALVASCGLVRCPACGYQFPRSSTLVEWGRKLLKRWRSPKP